MGGDISKRGCEQDSFWRPLEKILIVWIHLSKTAEETELGKKNLMIINYVWKIITK